MNSTHTPVSSLSLSPCFWFPGPFMRSLHANYWNKNRCLSFALDPLTHRSSPALSPAADLAEPRPPRHIPPPPDSGRGAVRPADPPTHISGEEFSHSHLYTRSVDHLEFKRLQSQIPTSDPRVGIFHAVEPLQRGVVQTESEFPSQEIISEGEAHLMPNTPSLWCCT